LHQISPIKYRIGLKTHHFSWPIINTEASVTASFSSTDCTWDMGQHENTGSLQQLQIQSWDGKKTQCIRKPAWLLDVCTYTCRRMQACC